MVSGFVKLYIYLRKYNKVQTIDNNFKFNSEIERWMFRFLISGRTRIKEYVSALNSQGNFLDISTNFCNICKSANNGFFK
ncbi:unnamed protein product [Rhizophagus irregularis]|nr:unnamed protein product [Rhizophagus irregularis]CAB4445787.1 unnamed protein product [Rhizophagus irregularis]